MHTIFIVEDDDNLREIVRYSLFSEGYNVLDFEDGASFWKEITLNKPSLCILDIMLPYEDGLEILKKLKQNPETSGIPVILLTAKSGEIDRVKGLDYGADDYVTKPFSVLELLARIRAVIRRLGDVKDLNTNLSVGNICLDVRKHEVSVFGESISLTYKEFELLQFLLQNKGYVLTRNLLMDKIWGFEYEGESRTVDVHIRTLRKKLGNCGDCIQTIRGVGYKVEEEQL